MENSYIVPETTLTEIADAIREKTGSTDNIAIEDFAINIKNISNSHVVAVNIVSTITQDIFIIDPETLKFTSVQLLPNQLVTVYTLNGIITWVNNVGIPYNIQGKASYITLDGLTTSETVSSLNIYAIIQCLESNCLIRLLDHANGGAD